MPDRPDNYTDNLIDQAAAMLGLDIPDACRDGIAANLDLLARHAKILESYLADQDDT